MLDQEHAFADRMDHLRDGRRRVRVHRHDGGALRGERLIFLPDADGRHRVSNEVFGDPIYGVVKACDRRTGAGSPPQP